MDGSSKQSTRHIKGVNEMNLDDLTEDQKADVMNLIIMTVKEIREQLDQDILFTQQIWERKGFMKSRRTRKAFEACRAIVQGKNEVFDKE
jgi:hypothetical protein